MTSESAVPELPSGWKPPFKFVDIGEHHFLQDGYSGLVLKVNCPEQTRLFLSSLLNAAYTPGGLRDRLAKAEAELQKLKTAKQ